MSGTEINQQQQPVEIEIFGPGPRPLLNNSREVLVADSTGLVETMEEDDVINDAPQRVLFPLKSKSPSRSETAETRTEVSKSVSGKPPLIVANMGEEDVTDGEEESLTALEEAGPPTPQSVSATSIVPGTPEQAVAKDLSRSTEILDEDMDDKSEYDSEMAAIDSDSSSGEDIEPSTSVSDNGTKPSVSVHVEVARRGNPTVISDGEFYYKNFSTRVGLNAFFF